MPGDTVSKRVKDISTKVKKGNIKEQKIPSQTAGSTEDAVLPKLVDRNGSLGLQLIILGVFCAVIGVVLFGLPSFQNYSDVHAVGKSITQWLHNIDVYFNIVSDNGPEKTEIVVERPFGRRKFSKHKPKHEIDETVRTGKNSKETNDRIENDYAKDYADFSNNNEHIIDYDSRSWYWFQDVWENSIGLIINFVNNVDGNNKRDTDSSLIGEIHYDHDNDVISIDDDDLAIDKSNDHNVNDGNMNDDSDDINGDDDDEISKNSYDNYKIKNKVNSNDGKVGDTFGSQKIDKWYKRKSVINIDNDVDKDDDTIYRNTMSYKSNRAIPKKRGKIIAIDENRATKSDKWLARLYRASRNIDKLKRSSAKVFVEVENDYDDIIRTDSDLLPDNYRRPNNEDQITSVDNNFDQTDDSDEDEGTRVEDDESNEDQDDVVNSENEDNDDVSEDKSTENSDSGENKIEGNNYYYEDDSDDEQNSIDIKIYNNEEENSDNIADTAEFNDESDEDNISDEVDSSSEEESTEEDQLNEEESSHGKRVYAKDRSQYIKSDYKNAVLKISIGISLIFVGYTVIIKKWRTYDDVVDESSASTKKREDELAKQTVQDVIDQISEELIQDQYKHDDDDEDEEEDSAEFPSDNEDGHDDVFLEENYVSSSSESSDEEREVKEQTNDYSRSDIRPVRTVTGNYNDDTNTTIDSDFERQENSSENLEPHWTASGPSILAREVEQSDESGSEEEEEEIEQTDDSENESDASNYDHSPKLYSRANITNQSDWVIKDELDEADSDLDEGKYNEALEKYRALLKKNIQSCRAKFGIAASLDKSAEDRKSNSILSDAIQAYMDALNCSDVPDALLKLIADKVISRMRFKGAYSNCIMVHNLLIDRFPDDVSVQNDLTITYLMLNRLKPAKDVLQRILSKWPDNGVAHVHYGFVLKMQTNYTEAVDYLRRGIRSNESGTQDARFYFHLGDALYRLGRGDEAAQVYEEGAAKNLFRSKYQRSFYNVDHLTGRPWWTLEQTTYENFFRTLEQNWKKIRDEGMNVLNQRQSLFSKEAELLRETGDWRQFEIYHRGTMKPDCDKVPFTCRLVSSFSPAASCRQGQIKFSLMLPNTHVWPHCGPTNARLRAHLGLVIPANVSSLRVAEDSRQWEEGKVLVFDDSFEHEVWHNGTSMRLVLIVDVWHPELTAYEKKTLPTI